jgi:osmotically-inducible protein OsmY
MKSSDQANTAVNKPADSIKTDSAKTASTTSSTNMNKTADPSSKPAAAALAAVNTTAPTADKSTQPLTANSGSAATASKTEATVKTNGAAPIDSKNQPKIDEVALITKIKTQFMTDSLLKGTPINIRIEKGAAELSGVVTKIQGDRAMEITRAVPNVNNVVNKMSIK